MRVALACWLLAVAALGIRAVSHFKGATSLHVYLLGGLHWRAGAEIYTTASGKGFVYGPLVAAWFAGLSFLPLWSAKILWLFLNAAAVLAGTVLALTRGPFDTVPARLRGLVLLLLLPLTMGNLDVAQANPLVAGLLLIAISAVRLEKPGVAALAVAFSVCLKIYPLAIGMLLCVVEPRRLTWRLLLALALTGLAAFLFQRPAYVASMYHDWIATRAGDDRLVYSMKKAPVDLWFVLVRLCGMPLSGFGYKLIQAGAGAGIALLCAAQRRFHTDAGPALRSLFYLGCVWMTLLGPATEFHTYQLAAPAVCIGCVEAFAARDPRASRWLAAGALLLLLLAQLVVSLFTSWQTPWVRAMQPIAMMMFAGYALATARR